MSVDSRVKKLSYTKDSIEFLKRLWTYASLDARCFALVWICGEVLIYRHYCLDESIGKVKKESENYYRVPNYPELWALLDKHLQKLLNETAKKGCHLYFQILPLSERPEKGRGSATNVKVARWLWADLDFKETVEKPEFEGCREGEDFELECYYREGGKWIHVRRPRLSEVLAKVREILGSEPTIVVDSGNGYHLYFELEDEVEASAIRPVEERLVDTLGADKQSKDIARILRLPGSINPRNGRPVVVIRDTGIRFSLDELRARLEPKREARAAEKPVEKYSEIEKPVILLEGELRALSDSDILEIKEMLKPAYVQGKRQYIWLYLSGWFAKARIDPISCIKVLLTLYKETGDQDSLKMRLAAVVYSYKKAGIDIDKYAEDIEKLTGVRPYGLDKEISEEAIKGKTGLQEILEEVLPEEQALEVIRRIEEKLGVASPFRDSIFALMDFEKKIFAVANLRKYVVVRARLDGNRLTYKDIVFIGAPTYVEVIKSPLGDITKYRVVWEIPTRNMRIELGPSTIDDILGRLRVEGLVLSRRYAEDVLNAIIEGFVRKGRAVLKLEIDKPGFYILDSKVAAVKYPVEKPSPEELREALLLLNELVENHYSKVKPKFVMVVKWGLTAPFAYARKQLKVYPPIPDLCLYGARNTAKTTQAEIACAYIWGLDPAKDKVSISVGEANTEYRFGRIVDRWTFGTVINEANSIFYKPELINLMKAKVDSTIVRGRYEYSGYREYLALSPIAYTMNPTPRVDFLSLDLVPKTLILLEYTSAEVLTPEEMEKFNREVKPRLAKLGAIGRWVAAYIIERGPEILKMDWLDLAEHLLAEMYKSVGLEPPEWVKLRAETKDYSETLEDKRLKVIDEIRDYINDQYSKHISKTVAIVDGSQAATIGFRHKLEALLQEGLISWAILKNGMVYITTEILRYIKSVPVANLRDLAEILGVPDRYLSKKSIKLGKETKNISVIELSLDELAELLSPEPVDEGTNS